MKKYEIRAINTEEQRRTDIYFVDEYEVKNDDYGYKYYGITGKSIGIKEEGKKRRTWLSTNRRAYQIIDTATGEVVAYYDNQEDLMIANGYEELIAKVRADYKKTVERLQNR